MSGTMRTKGSWAECTPQFLIWLHLSAAKIDCKCKYWLPPIWNLSYFLVNEWLSSCSSSHSEICHLMLCAVRTIGSNQYGSILGHTSVSSGSLLDDHHWHSVVIERYRRNVNFTLDQQTQHFRTNGEFDYLDLDYEVKEKQKKTKHCQGSVPYNLLSRCENWLKKNL